MAPDRGSPPSGLTPGDNEDGDLQISSSSSSSRHNRPANPLRQRHPHRSTAQRYFAEHASEPQSFTIRGVLVGLVIGVVICFSNMYFGLQTGWVSGMAMPSALIGFAYFKTVARYIDYPFTPVENVLVQSVAGSVGTMPLGCGFVGVIPALNYLLKPEENGPLEISLWKLIVWAVGICFFGVVFAVPLRREVIIREKLKFPSGTATALMIRVLHGDQKSINQALEGSGDEPDSLVQEQQALLEPPLSNNMEADHNLVSSTTEQIDEGVRLGQQGDWKAKIRLLFISFAVSAGYVCISDNVNHSSQLLIIMLDTRLVLYSSTSWDTNSGSSTRTQLALETKPVARLRRTGYNYGTCNNSPYVPWCNRRLGCPISPRAKEEMGAWASR